MKPRHSFSARHTRRIDNITRQRESFPKVLLKVINRSDIVIEVLDSRFIDDTRNQEIENFIKMRGKKIMYAINKIDLTGKDKVRQNYDLKDIFPYVFISATKRQGGKELRNKIKALAKQIRKKEDFERVYVGVIGYPNTGKSSIINLLIGKNSAPTAGQAGFTKGVQKLKLTKEITILDSPGVIPAKEYSTVELRAIAKHAKVGSRTYDKVRDAEMIVARLFKSYADKFQKYYDFETEDSEELIEHVGKKKNLFKRGGEVDTDKASRIILRDWQEGNIKAI